MTAILKVILLISFLQIYSAFHLKHKKKASEIDFACRGGKILIISRNTGYNLSLALRFVGENGVNYYWTVLNNHPKAIPNTEFWVNDEYGLKNLYNGQYLYIDGARNAILVDKMQTNVNLDYTTVPGYTLVDRFGLKLTNLEDGASFFSANYGGAPIFIAILQHWNIHCVDFPISQILNK